MLPGTDRATGILTGTATITDSALVESVARLTSDRLHTLESLERLDRHMYMGEFQACLFEIPRANWEFLFEAAQADRYEPADFLEELTELASQIENYMPFDVHRYVRIVRSQIPRMPVEFLISALAHEHETIIASLYAWYMSENLNQFLQTLEAKKQMRIRERAAFIAANEWPAPDVLREAERVLERKFASHQPQSHF